MRKVKWFFQRVFRGYSDYDIIDYGEFLCKKILPSLKHWHSLPHLGNPTGLTYEEWMATLDKILWAVEEEATHKNEDAIYYGPDYYKLTSDEKTQAFNSVQDRLQEGLELFGKYLSALWDQNP